MSALLDLAARVEALSGPDREVDCLIEMACGPDGPAIQKLMAGSPHNTIDEVAKAADREGGKLFFRVPRYTASIDAAMTLVPEGWRGRIFIGDQSLGSVEIGGPHSAFFTPPNEWKPELARSELCWSPSLAVCAAALRAKAGQP